MRGGRHDEEDSQRLTALEQQAHPGGESDGAEEKKQQQIAQGQVEGYLDVPYAEYQGNQQAAHEAAGDRRGNVVTLQGTDAGGDEASEKNHRDTDGEDVETCDFQLQGRGLLVNARMAP